MTATTPIEEALRTARAASHSRRLDTATAAAVEAIVAFGHAVVDRDREIERALADVRARLSALESVRPLIDP